MKFEDAVMRIEALVNTRYDEKVVAAFTAACREGQIRPGSVRLKRPVPGSPKPELLSQPEVSERLAVS